MEKIVFLRYVSANDIDMAEERFKTIKAYI
jgi:hypothetical protein